MRNTAQTTAGARKDIANVYDATCHGSDVVSRAVESMGRIEGSSREISQITAVIDGIAFQTNLLALNAGVEAARAGDAGRGFAVVASEVRALAQRSAEAAGDIKELIAGSAQHVSMGVELVAETGRALAIISERISGIRGAIEVIAESADIQAANLGQINSAVCDVDRMTQQNAAMSEECTAAAASLAQQAADLNRTVQGASGGTSTSRQTGAYSQPLARAA